jgi:hypothetical protein
VSAVAELKLEAFRLAVGFANFDVVATGPTGTNLFRSFSQGFAIEMFTDLDPGCGIRGWPCLSFLFAQLKLPRAGSNVPSDMPNDCWAHSEAIIVPQSVTTPFALAKSPKSF